MITSTNIYCGSAMSWALLWAVGIWSRWGQTRNSTNKWIHLWWKWKCCEERGKKRVKWWKYREWRCWSRIKMLVTWWDMGGGLRFWKLSFDWFVSVRQRWVSSGESEVWEENRKQKSSTVMGYQNWKNRDRRLRNTSG